MDERVNNYNKHAQWGEKIQLQTIYRKTEIKTKEIFFLLYSYILIPLLYSHYKKTEMPLQKKKRKKMKKTANNE